MTKQERIQICGVCTKRAFDLKKGTICSLTKESPAFDNTCPDFIEDKKIKKAEENRINEQKSSADNTINKGRYALFIIGGIYTLIGFYEGFAMIDHDILYGIVDWVIAGIFIGLGVWSYRKASLAMIIGLSVYILIIILLALGDPSTILSGIIWKVLIISGLVMAIKQARSVEVKTTPKSDELLDDF